MLSSKPIPPEERLIFALDVPSAEQARALVEALGDSVRFYKLGLELFMAGGYYELLAWLKARGKRTFVDLKFFDVPNTVASAVRQLRAHGPDFTTVHGNDAILRAACAEKGDIKILAVTVLTSLDDGDMRALGFQADAGAVVLSRAQRALDLGCDGVISSGLEAERLRGALGPNFLVVVPGIRPVANKDDQKRTVDVEEAFEKGADYIVVGRPIAQAPDPRAAAQAIQARIASLFAA
jgi:orotidine-5'-phosphate decarboxylase